jgi:TetR/AcrR family transcriptional regulator, mexJK operon transcriptional repressor
LNEMTAIPRPRAGRPTREQAEARHGELLEVALDHFLEKGYEAATIDAIAGAVNMTKRTVYGLYADKSALFHAAVHRAIERYAITEERIQATDSGDLEQTLRNIARLRIDLVASPQGMKLQRIINTESYRFPEIFNEVYELGALPTIKFLARLLRRESDAGRLAIGEPAMAANVFMSMVVSGPVRIMVSGNALSAAEIEQRIAFAVRLFLNGARSR